MSPTPSESATTNDWMHEPLAIVGMACRLPGGDGLPAFWQLLQNGGCGIDRFPESFLDRPTYYQAEKGIRGKTYSDVGGLISDRPLDWSIMPIPVTAADQWDPCHLILCEVAAQACIRAGYDPRQIQERQTGVYIGHSGGSTRGGEFAYRTLLGDYVDLLEEVPAWRQIDSGFRRSMREELLAKLRQNRPERQLDGGPMVDAGYAAGLLSRAFGLTGPHMVIDAACASSLVALALSAAALHSGQIEMAMVGGASMNKPDSLILFSQAQSCSATGSRPFDAAADGLISSEGYVVLLLKTLEKAVACGDRIEAVIRGIGVSSDGRGRSLWAPRKEGQETAIQRAYFPGVTPDSVQLVEAHATSTQVGDATEMEALATFFQRHLNADHRIPVGSVKSNIGHTLETAGLAGLVKVVLSIQNGIIPPSIHVQELNRTIAWDDIPLYVPQQSLPWPSLLEDQPRRAAVNAFGIGGLNVHVVVDQYLPSQHGERGPRLQAANERTITSQSRVTLRDAQGASPLAAIAVIGRGLVLPGALDVAAFAEMLARGTSPLGPPPVDRWRRPHDQLTNVGESGPNANTLCGGFITEFAYDWRKHKVPPKQIAQANPLQFMLLEAAEQALQEAGYLNKKWDRLRAAVVVGSVFGGDFGNALYAGLRLPEFRQQLEFQLGKAGLNRERVQSLVTEYENLFLKAYPALLDETGSFTSSTLASRLSKTFDLMGGALAIDAGDASSLAALDASINLLRSGAVDHVLCATSQRAMDRASLQRLSLHGRLATFDQLSHSTDATRPSLARSIPAEGVALVLVKRLDQALADGDTVYATIHDVTAAVDAQSTDRSLASAQHKIKLPRVLKTPLPVLGAINPSMAMQTCGNLQAAQGIVDLIECSLQPHAQNEIKVITQQTFSGLSYCAAIEVGHPLLAQPLHPMPDAKPEPQPAVSYPVPTTNQNLWRIIRLSSDDRATLEKRLGEVESLNWDELNSVCQPVFNASHAWRAALVVAPDDYRGKASLLKRQLGEKTARVPLAEQGLYWSQPTSRTKKIAWIFPGQGSQYPNMLRELAGHDSVAADAMLQCDRALLDMRQPGFGQFAWNDASRLGEDVWQTQASMLVSDYVIAACLRARGCEAHLVAGHSFGEFAAMLAAGCWDLPTAFQATWFRCRSIVENVTGNYGMLSIQASATSIDELIQRFGSGLSISHRNAPEQTVVGGKQAAVAQFAQLMESEGIASRLLAVPTAFHTPALAPAQSPFRAALESVAIEPPQLPLLSSVTNRYVADPVDLRAGLVHQLIAPLDFVKLVERLVADGVGLIVEVGPQQVLTRLVRQWSAIHGSTELMSVSTDHPKRGTQAQLLCAQACIEVMQTSVQESVVNRSMSVAKPQSSPPAHFDATERRRDRVRQSASVDFAAVRRQSESQSSVPTAPIAALHYDASQVRRDRNRQETSAPAGLSVVTSDASSVQSPNSPSLPRTRLEDETPLVQALPKKTSPDKTPIIESFLIDFVVEQTGYPSDIIQLDWDLEADLGIDSIKKAQLFGELREFFDLESLQGFSLDRFQTLRDIVNLLITTPGKGDWLDRSQEPAVRPEPISVDYSSTSTSALGAVTDEAANSTPSASQSQSHQGMDARRLEQFLIDFVVEQTGYPAEIVELDADLEADLGIDSIKKAQLFGELREMFTFPTLATADNRVNLADYRNLRSVLDLLIASDATETPAAPFAIDLTPRIASSNAVTPVVEMPMVEMPMVEMPMDEMPVEEDTTTHDGVTWANRLVDVSGDPGQIPTCLIHDDESSSPRIDASPVYTQAVWKNLNAMVGRIGGHKQTELLDSAANGESRQRTSIQATGLLELAEVTGASEQSLEALGATLCNATTWKPLPLSRVEEEAGEAAPAEGASLIPLMEFTAPRWLTSGGGVPVALQARLLANESYALELATPGVLTSSMQILPSGFLVAAGLLNDPSSATVVKPSISSEPITATRQLQQWMRDCQTATKQSTPSVPTLSRFEDSARELKISADWWVMAVDLNRAQRLLVESRQGVVVIEKEKFSDREFRQGNDVERRPAALTTSAVILLNARLNELWIRTAIAAPPHAPAELRVPLSTLQAWICRNTNSLTVTAPESDSETLLASTKVTRTVELDSAGHDPSTNEITRRFVLRMVPSPQRVTTGRRPVWSGAALIIGDNRVANQLEARLRSANVRVTRWAGTEDPMELARRFEDLSNQYPVRHLFLTTACDELARSTLDRHVWQKRRNQGLMSSYWLCQRWHQHVCASGWVDDASLVAVTSLGGDFGLANDPRMAAQIHSIEGGGLSGLLKSILIESWVQGFRTFPIKVLDTHPSESPAQIVDNLWQELAVPSFDLEIAYHQGIRQVMRAIAKPLSVDPKVLGASKIKASKISRGGTWVCTGGARGITAFAAEQLAREYQLVLHLLGTSPMPAIDPAWRELDDQALKRLKAEVMTAARQAAKNPITTWQDTEKLLEIDRTLRKLAAMGIEAHYHCCDVSDRDQVEQVLGRVRELSGPIRGVLHGAGVGKDARFDRKQAEKVQQCIGAKVDGAWALIEATWSDPLEAFVGFGSISGRFGANGHTDYSLANDMLCKQMDWLRAARPSVRAIGFHWHAWGDIGMATKPETRLALEMINMQFMPATEGIRHLMRELESDSHESEVLITDDRYYRLFYSPDPLLDKHGRTIAGQNVATPLLTATNEPIDTLSRVHSARLEPAKDPFLVEHRLDDRPLLPIVIGTELLLEAARAHLGHSRPLRLRHVQAIQGLRFYGDQPQVVRITTKSLNNGSIECRLLSDFHARDGRLVQPDRVNLVAEVESTSLEHSSPLTRIEMAAKTAWHRPEYPPPGSKFYAGLPLQRLRGFAMSDHSLIGKITAPALIELAGGSREVRGWQLPSSAVDACLFAAGILAWQQVATGSALPTSFGEIAIGRLPYPGEACEVHVVLQGHGGTSGSVPGNPSPPGSATFHFTLYGIDGDVLVNVRDYRVAWLTDPVQSGAAASSAALR